MQVKFSLRSNGLRHKRRGVFFGGNARHLLDGIVFYMVNYHMKVNYNKPSAFPTHNHKFRLIFKSFRPLIVGSCSVINISQNSRVHILKISFPQGFSFYRNNWVSPADITIIEQRLIIDFVYTATHCSAYDGTHTLVHTHGSQWKGNTKHRKS